MVNVFPAPGGPNIATHNGCSSPPATALQSMFLTVLYVSISRRSTTYMTGSVPNSITGTLGESCTFGSTFAKGVNCRGEFKLAGMPSNTIRLASWGSSYSAAWVNMFHAGQPTGIRSSPMGLGGSTAPSAPSTESFSTDHFGRRSWKGVAIMFRVRGRCSPASPTLDRTALGNA